IEERESGVVRVQSVFSPVYVDALILRDRDADGSSGNGLEERLWVQQDANWNVTALTDSAGGVLERYLYDPSGVATVMTAGWVTRTASLYAWGILYQGGRQEALSGLLHFRNRELSPSLGRWVQNDPMGIQADGPAQDPAFRNNPHLWTDPFGLKAQKLVPNTGDNPLPPEYVPWPEKDWTKWNGVIVLIAASVRLDYEEEYTRDARKTFKWKKKGCPQIFRSIRSLDDIADILDTFKREG